MSSVLQDWVMELPLRAQGTLLTAVRGCDLTPKQGGQLDRTERQLVALLRYCILNPADPREIDIPGAFFQSHLPERWKASELGHYPMHWYSHIMHAFQVVAYLCPDVGKGAKGHLVYMQLVHALHLYPEPREQMLKRLTEDRIAAGTVVS